MSKKGIEKAAKKLQEYYSQFPDWYWAHGLHDAEILSVCELELSPDWKSETPRRNCLEICLDSSGALYERDIRKICLYNYKIKTPEINISALQKPWWMGDTITQLPDRRYLLEIKIETANGKHKQFAVEFEIPEVIRE